MASFVTPLVFPSPLLSPLRQLFRAVPMRLSCSLPVSDESHMQTALSQARSARALGEVPIGAALVSDSGTIIATGHNLVESTHDVTAHAELVCLRRAMAARKNWRLLGTTLYSTLEPCPMCLSALALARVQNVVYGAKDLRLGACGTWIDLAKEEHPFHTFGEIRGGVLEEEAARLMRDFFRRRREDSNGAKGESANR